MRPLHLHCLTAAQLFLAWQGAAQSAARLPDTIAPHRAVYEISLARSDEGSGVSTAKGRMVFEITGNACEGYRMRQRMMVNIGDEEGNLGLLDFRIATFESGDGKVYNFDALTRLNASTVETVAGEAHRTGSGIEVNLTQPSKKTVRLAGEMLFPSQHMRAILDAALAERKFVSVEIYEGAGTGEDSDQASAAIGKVERGVPGDKLRAGIRYWPVSVGYFGRENAKKDDFGEEMPYYQMRFSLYENGVTNDLIMDYGNYALAGSLEQIEPMTAADCPSP